MPYAADLQRAIDTNDTGQMRSLLEAMRRRNVGEATIPGLRDLCRKARRILREQDADSTEGDLTGTV